MNNNKTLALTTAAPCGFGRNSAADFSGAHARAFSDARRGDAAACPPRVGALWLEPIEATRAARNDGANASALGRSRSQRGNGRTAGWPVGMALLTLFVLGAAMGITAAMAPRGNLAGSDPLLAKVATIAGDDDGYVEGLARIGVTALPGQPAIPAEMAQ